MRPQQINCSWKDKAGIFGLSRGTTIPLTSQVQQPYLQAFLEFWLQWKQVNIPGEKYLIPIEGDIPNHIFIDSFFGK